MTTIQQRRGTAAQWTSANPILAAGEPGFETDTGNLKIGDGAAHWTSLGYANHGTYASVVNVLGYGAKGDGATNDTAAVQAALAAVIAAGGGILYFPAGTYLCHGLHITAGSVGIVGASIGATTLKLLNGTDDYVIYSNPGAAITGITIAEMTIDGNKANNPGAAGGVITLQGFSAAQPIRVVRLQNIRCINPNGFGVGLGYVDDFVEDNVRVENSGDNGFDHNGVTHGAVIACRAVDSGNIGFFCGDNSCSDVDYVACVSLRSVNMGFVATSFAGATTTDICYLGCVADGTVNYDGFSNGTSGGTFGRVYWTTCVSKNNGRNGFAPSAGYSFLSDSEATNNTSGPLQSFGATKVTWTGGFVDSTTGMFGASNLDAHNVVGFNPVGPWGAGTPASGAELQNVIGSDVTVYMTGGAVTQVAVGPSGAETNLGAVGTFRLPAGQYMKLTYTVAPTLVYMAD